MCYGGGSSGSITASLFALTTSLSSKPYVVQLNGTTCFGKFQSILPIQQEQALFYEKRYASIFTVKMCFPIRRMLKSSQHFISEPIQPKGLIYFIASIAFSYSFNF